MTLAKCKTRENKNNWTNEVGKMSVAYTFKTILVLDGLSHCYINININFINTKAVKTDHPPPLLLNWSDLSLT